MPVRLIFEKEGLYEPQYVRLSWYKTRFIDNKKTIHINKFGAPFSCTPSRLYLVVVLHKRIP